MKTLKKYSIVLITLATSQVGFAQHGTESNFAMNIAVNFSPLSTPYAPCGLIEFEHTYKNRFTTGLYFNAGVKTTPENFGYTIESPVVNYTAIGWINGIKVLNKQGFTITASLSNNFSFIRLGDNAQKSTHYNGKTLYSISKEITTDYCYSLVPKVAFSKNLYRTLNLYSALGYQLNIGHTFTDIQAFNGITLAVGVQLQIN